MLRSIIRAAAVALILFVGATAMAAEGAFVLDHKFKDIDGKEVDLSEYKGKVVMIVNVASKCGLTPQYKDLVELHTKYKDQGFEILGFPANNFMSQEPGTNAEIKDFCTDNFNVGFELFEKSSVKGGDINPLYSELTSTKENGEFGGEIKWNFTKFLVGRDGKVIARFEPKTKPNEPAAVGAIEKALATK